MLQCAVAAVYFFFFFWPFLETLATKAIYWILLLLRQISFDVVYEWNEKATASRNSAILGSPCRFHLKFSHLLYGECKQVLLRLLTPPHVLLCLLTGAARSSPPPPPRTLQYAELPPAPLQTTPEAEALFEEKATEVCSRCRVCLCVK